MRRNCSILFLILVLFPGISSAQIYCHIWGDYSEIQKSTFKEAMMKSARIFDMENVTFSIMKCRLPNGVNATTEYEDNIVVKRKMILFRINDCVQPEEYSSLIAHEMIHAYQFYSKQLIRIDQFTFLWQGEKYTNINRIHHHKRPWEIEAIEQSEYLVSIFDDQKERGNLASQLLIKKYVLSF